MAKVTSSPSPLVAEVGLLIYPDCQLSAVHGLTDLFRIASEWPECSRVGNIRVSHWQATEDGALNCVWSSDADPPDHLDYVIAPPSVVMPESMRPMRFEADWLRTRHQAGSRICSVCAGAFVLAESGLIHNRRVTTHWAFASQLAERYPDIDVVDRNMVFDDGDILSAGGILAWTDLGLTLVERLFGRSTMLATARFLVIAPPRSTQLPFAEFLPPFDHGDEAILKVQHYIQAHVADALRLNDLADKAHLGLRTFMRRFLKSTSHKPTEYIQQVRIAKARGMLELTSRSIDQIAWDVGYKDPSSFSKIFLRLTGLSATEYRRQFGIESE